MSFKAKSIGSFFGGPPGVVTLVDGKVQKRPRDAGAAAPPAAAAAAPAAPSAAAGGGSVGSIAADDGATISLAALRKEVSGDEVEALRKKSAAAQARLQAQLAASAASLAAAGAQVVQLQRQVQAGQHRVAQLTAAFAPAAETTFVQAVTQGSAQGVQYALSLGFANLDLTGPRWTRKTALMYACFNGHAAVVRVLLAAGANKYKRLPGAAGGAAHTAFSSAEAGGHREAILYLLDESRRLPFGGDEEVRDRGGRCTLTGAGLRGVASKEGLARAITACLSPRDAAALLTASRRIWRDAGEQLRRACTAGNAAAVSRLLEEAGDGADSLVASAGSVAGESALMRACRAGQVDIARLLLSEGADKAAVARSGDPHEHRPRRRDAFYYAELAADPAARTALLQLLDASRVPPQLYEINWQRRFRSAATLTGCGGALHQVPAASVLASFLTKRERFQLAGTCRATWRHVPAGLSAEDQERVRTGSRLWHSILNGIDEVDDEEDGRPMLLWAAAKGDLPLVRELLDWRASPNATWFCGRTALSEALRRGHLDVAMELVARGASTSPIDDDGDVEDILGEDPDAAGEDDETAPLILAISHGFTAFAHELIARGADVNARISRSFEPALAAAVRRGDAGLVRALIDKGANLEATFELPTEFDVISFTSLRLACSRGRADIVRMLVAAGCAVTVEEPMESSILGDAHAKAGLGAPGTRAAVLAALQPQ